MMVVGVLKCIDAPNNHPPMLVCVAFAVCLLYFLFLSKFYVEKENRFTASTIPTVTVNVIIIITVMSV